MSYVDSRNLLVEVAQTSTKNKIAIGYGFAPGCNAILTPVYANIPNDGASQYHDQFQNPPGPINSNSVDTSAFVVTATRDNPDNAIYGHWVVQWGDPFWLHLWVAYSSAGGTAVYGLITEQPNFYLSVDDLRARWKTSPVNKSWITNKIYPPHDPMDQYWGEFGIQYDETGTHGVYMLLHMEIALRTSLLPVLESHYTNFSGVFAAYPELLPQKKIIVAALKSGADPSPENLALINCIKPRIAGNGAVSHPPLSTLSLTKCQTAAIKVAADALGLILSMLGVAGSAEILDGVLAKVFSKSPALIDDVVAAIPAFKNADGAWNKAKALVPILKILYKSGSIMDAVKECIKSMSWWQRIKIVAQVTATLALWFVTDGAALVAQVVLIVMSAADLIQDAIAADKACRG